MVLALVPKSASTDSLSSHVSSDDSFHVAKHLELRDIPFALRSSSSSSMKSPVTLTVMEEKEVHTADYPTEPNGHDLDSDNDADTETETASDADPRDGLAIDDEDETDFANKVRYDVSKEFTDDDSLLEEQSYTMPSLLLDGDDTGHYYGDDSNDMSHLSIAVAQSAEQIKSAASPVSAQWSPPTWMIYVALVLAQMMWSGFHVCSKFVFSSGQLTPMVLPTFRTLGVVPIFAAWAYHKNPTFYIMTPRQHGLMILEGLLGNAIAQQLFNFGESLSSATLAGAMQPCIPIFTTVLAILLKREKSSLGKAIGIVVAVSGSLVMVFVGTGGSDGGNSSTAFLGAVCFIIQCLCTSVYIIIQKPMFAQGLDVNTFTFYMFLYGGVAHIFIGAFFLPDIQWSQLEWTLIPIIAYVCIFATFAAFSLFVYATKHLPASISSLGICLQSFFSPTLGYIFLGETLSPFGILGGLCIVAGIVIVVLAKNHETKADEAAKAVAEITKSLPDSDSESESDGDEADGDDIGFHQESTKIVVDDSELADDVGYHQKSQRLSQS